MMVMMVSVKVMMMVIPITLPTRTVVITGCMSRIKINNAPANLTPPDSGKNAPSSSDDEYKIVMSEQYEYRLASIR